MVCHTILDAIGHTPLVRLNRIVDANSATVLVKVEGLNVGGSIKTRTAYQMVKEAEAQGLLHEHSVLVEATSGNQGIGLALVGAVMGYPTLIIMPDSVSQERRLLMEHYGATVILIHDEGNIGACIEACLQTALRMQQDNPNIFIPQQFENPANPLAHRLYTANEILEQAGCPIDGFCAGIGTGGTLTGIGEVLKKRYPTITIWAIEPQHAALLSGGTVASHQQMGIGDGIIPTVLNQQLYDHVCVISDDEAIETARQLARLEGLACGITGGSNVAAAKRLAKQLGGGKVVVTVLPDTAERYYTTSLFQSH